MRYNSPSDWKKVKYGYSHYWVYKPAPRFIASGGDGDSWSAFLYGGDKSVWLGLPSEPTREFIGYAIEDYADNTSTALMV